MELAIHSSQIFLLALLQQVKGHTEISLEYVDYVDVYFLDLTIELFKNSDINKYAIKLIEGKQPLYRPIYSLGSVKLEMLKAYIETYLRAGFIQPSKSPTNTSIFFYKKLNWSLRLYVNYQRCNNLTIKI